MADRASVVLTGPHRERGLAQHRKDEFLAAQVGSVDDAPERFQAACMVARMQLGIDNRRLHLIELELARKKRSEQFDVFEVFGVERPLGGDLSRRYGEDVIRSAAFELRRDLTAQPGLARSQWQIGNGQAIVPRLRATGMEIARAQQVAAFNARADRHRHACRSAASPGGCGRGIENVVRSVDVTQMADVVLARAHRSRRFAQHREQKLPTVQARRVDDSPQGFDALCLPLRCGVAMQGLPAASIPSPRRARSARCGYGFPFCRAYS